MSEKSLQINISRVDDAKSVIQHLDSIKQAYEAHGCTSVEFAIVEAVVTPTTPILAGVIGWCKTFRKIVKPFGENVMFTFPDSIPQKRFALPPEAIISSPENGQTVSSKPAKVNRYLRNVETGKSATLVQSPQSGAT